jgi:hypothetical protein
VDPDEIVHLEEAAFPDMDVDGLIEGEKTTTATDGESEDEDEDVVMREREEMEEPDDYESSDDDAASEAKRNADVAASVKGLPRPPR